MKCLACDGTGTYLYENDPPAKCPDCDGTGEVPEDFYDGNAAMTDKIQPALTSEEWAEVRRAGGAIRYDTAFEALSSRSLHEQSRAAFYLMALANAALPDDDPRKITHEDIVSLMRCVRREWPTSNDEQRSERVIRVLESLLPPDVTTYTLLPPEG